MIRFLLDIRFFRNKLKKIFFIILNFNFLKGYLNLVFPLLELSELLKKLPKIDNCIDIGSNKGQFLMIFRKYFSQAKLYSFEPQKKLIKIQKSFLNNSKFYNFCLGNYNGTSTFNITERNDSSSLLKPKQFTDTIYRINKKIKTRVCKLDDVIKLDKNDTNLIKIDVQGYEYQVLLGSKKTLKKIKFIIIEISSDKNYYKEFDKAKTLSFLNANNFHLKKIYNKTYDGKSWQADFLFINKNKNLK
ncbi:FkbM family methyltransferase [Candidatus Pelagibacter sp. Uisw_114]|tara:strand:+ start:1182 stop:1916 length:735 start_codon:yes stop_codon:yes gene_type:complete